MRGLLTISSLLFVSVTFVVTQVGCDPKKNNRPARPARSNTSAESSAVGEAMKYLPMIMRLDRSVAVKEVTFQLNSWARNKQNYISGTTQELIAKLPEESRATPLFTQVGNYYFTDLECEYLLQCQLMKHVTKWVLVNPYRDDLFATWIAEHGATLSADHRRQLEDTVKLFDWTMRNVALDGPANDAEQLTSQPSWPLSDDAAMYRQLPWQTMIFGRGDAWQRARVFTQLLSQIDIVAGIVAIGDNVESPNPWVVGVPIGGEIYLFEPKWGLPLPGPGEKGIATLSQARSDRNILRRAKLPGQFEYPVSAEDLEQAHVMLDVEPFAVLGIMNSLEESLAGENRMNIFVDSADAIAAFSTLDKSKISMWNIPLMAQAYNQSVRTRLFDQSPFSLQYLAQNGPFLTDTLINFARQDHFKGEFESTIDREGALKNYMGSRIDDETLDKLSQDLEIQKRLSVSKKLNESFEDFLMRLEQIKLFYRVAKYHTSAFLGMAQFDLGNIDAAINWLDDRTLQVEGTEMWHAHAEYLLARCYEATGNSDKAQEYLKLENRPQEAGNRIRARLLQYRSAPEKSE